MTVRVLFLVASLALNGAFAAAFALHPALAPTALRDFFQGSRTRESVVAANRAVTAQQLAVATRAAATAKAKLWSTLDASDLRQLVAQLRAAGFPASVIRAIVSAKLDAQFSARVKAVVAGVASTPYWKRPLNSPYNVGRAYEELSQATRDRSKLLREVLGDDFFSGTGADSTAAQRRQFGDLPRSKIDLLQRINDDYAEMVSQVRAGTNGIMLPEDREKLALLEREKHADLAAVLTAQELADYEIRNSPITSRLSSALALIDASETEFRTIYALQQQFASRINPPIGMTSGLMDQRREATAELNSQLRAALGEARANEFIRAQDSEYQNLVQMALRANLPLTAAVSAYDVRTNVTEQSVRIVEDRTMTTEQKSAAMTVLAQNGRDQLMAALGPTAGASYANSALWLRAIGSGTSVQYIGTTTYYRPISSAPPPPR